MARRLIAFLPLAAAAVGCANTWDAITSKKWKDAPFKRTFAADDEPMYVLRNKVEGDERAKAMRRLKEPAQDGKAGEQDEALQILGTAAVNEPSPVVRTAAIDALGRFKDPRVVRLLVAAYMQADAVPGKAVNEPAVKQVALGVRGTLDDPTLDVPGGFPAAFVATIRTRAVTALAATKQAEAVNFLAEVATRKPEGPADDASRDLRIAAVQGLTAMRLKACVPALAQVLAAEQGRDVAVVGRAHEGLVELTGKDLPADPEPWTKLAQSGVEVVPEPSMLQRAVHLAAP